MTRFQPNARLLQAAHQLEQLARQVTEAVDHVNRELAIADSYPTQVVGASLPTGTGFAPVCRCEALGTDGCDVCTPVKLSPTERAAERRIRFESDRVQVDDDIRCIEETIASLSKTCRSLIGTRLVHGVQRCDGRPYEGSDVLWTPHSRDPENGWYDPTCADAADESSLCAACRIRERRWRDKHGLQPRRTNAGTAAA